MLRNYDKQRSCDGKVRYGHKETAKHAVKAMAVKGIHSLEPYRCRHCGGWHLGHRLDESFVTQIVRLVIE